MKSQLDSKIQLAFVIIMFWSYIILKLSKNKTGDLIKITCFLINLMISFFTSFRRG